MDRKIKLVVSNTAEDIERHRIDTMPGSIKCDYCGKRWRCIDDMMCYASKCQTCTDHRNRRKKRKK